MNNYKNIFLALSIGFLIASPVASADTTSNIKTGNLVITFDGESEGGSVRVRSRNNYNKVYTDSAWLTLPIDRYSVDARTYYTDTATCVPIIYVNEPWYPAGDQVNIYIYEDQTVNLLIQYTCNPNM